MLSLKKAAMSSLVKCSGSGFSGCAVVCFSTERGVRTRVTIICVTFRRLAKAGSIHLSLCSPSSLPRHDEGNFAHYNLQFYALIKNQSAPTEELLLQQDSFNIGCFLGKIRPDSRVQDMKFPIWAYSAA